MELVEPRKKYWVNFLGAVEEYKKEGRYGWMKSKTFEEYQKKTITKSGRIGGW
ncbi:MAG: hypothetical protein WC686_05185 [Candidatus Shapirobacteria bacterium]|jgi:hypothetical protein